MDENTKIIALSGMFDDNFSSKYVLCPIWRGEG